MNDQEFIRRIQEKIQRLTGRSVELNIDRREANQLQVEFQREVPLVVLGSDIVQYPGFARMCVEYSVACIRQQRHINQLEFQLLLARN